MLHPSVTYYTRLSAFVSLDFTPHVSCGDPIPHCLLQVVSLLSSVLDILYPPRPQQALNFLGVAAVDVHNIFQLECWHAFDWYGQWWLAVAGLPCTLMAIVAASWAWKRQRRGPEGQAETAAEARSAAFFVVMLLYPRVSSRIFAVLRCRWLGPESVGPSVLEADYSVSCMTSHHHHYMTLARVLVVAIPLGVPLVALAVLLRASRAHRAAHAAGELGAALAPLPELGEDDGVEEAKEAFIHAQLAERYCLAFSISSIVSVATSSVVD